MKIHWISVSLMLGILASCGGEPVLNNSKYLSAVPVLSGQDGTSENYTSNQVNHIYHQTQNNQLLVQQGGGNSQPQWVRQQYIQPVQLIPGTDNFTLAKGPESVPLPEPNFIELPKNNESVTSSSAIPVSPSTNEPPVTVSSGIEGIEVKQDFNYALTQDVLVNLKVLNPNNNPYQGVMIYVCDVQCEGQQYLIKGVTSASGDFQSLIRVPSAQEQLLVISSGFGVKNKVVLPIENQQINYVFGNQ